MASSAIVRLSKHDFSVLGALFDPEASLQNPLLVAARGPDEKEEDDICQLRSLERRVLLNINEERPSVISMEKAIKDLGNIIATHPSYASAWNNRAQATRMLSEITNSPMQDSQLISVYRDLTRAIELSTPSGIFLNVSASAAAVLASAHTHRGYLLRNSLRSESIGKMIEAIDEFKDMDRDRIEELASRDFSLGGRYGNKIAQQMAVKTNPYAKLCGSIVREAMQKEIEEYRSEFVSDM